MDKKQIEQIRKNMEAKSTEELLEIWVENDRKRYYEETFEVVKQVLLKRGETIPPQGEEGRRFLMEAEKRMQAGNSKKLDVVKQLLLEREEKIPPEGEEIILLSEQAQQKPAWGIGSKICLIYVVLFVIFKVVGGSTIHPTTADEGGKYAIGIDDRRLLLVDSTKGEIRVFNLRTGEFIYEREEIWDVGRKIVVKKDGFRYEYMPGSWNEIKYELSDPFNAMGEISSFQMKLLRSGWSPKAAFDWDITRPSFLGIIFVVCVIVVLVAIVRGEIDSLNNVG